MSKMKETVISDTTVRCSERPTRSTDLQYRFRRERSCLSPLLKFYNYFSSTHDVTVSLNIAYVDFQKEFDKVSLNTLKFQAKEFGITDNAHNSTENQFSNVKEKVAVNGTA